ncbi:substrate-binding domain-containing protein [Acinetobacter puyangensis]|uniref:Transcriptional regulator, LacI family n=1 Tax=Acinetobacter puyangensis TaxID=1096779 RepID=A0A240E428_9GAMM|nr:substrate-binding domain-containing protein [Acinetobacter puyangensis]SNX43281.1 transcriptional regulator, LacI family [Acinetobacter puyangensis]
MSLKAIAAELGLSLTTVSRALNDYPEVSSKTKIKVKQVADRLGYVPNSIARGLALGRANAVGIVFPATVNDLGDVNYLHVLSSMSERFAKEGIDLLIISAPPEHELATYERIIKGGRVDAFIVPRTKVHDERLAYLHQRKIPFVAHGRSEGFIHPYAWFDMDNAHGAALAAKQLINAGHRSIAYLGADLSYNFIQQRYQAFKNEVCQYPDIRLQEYRIGLEQNSGFLVTQHLLEQTILPDAIFVDNHMAAVGVLLALSKAGLNLNQDIKVIVYGMLSQQTILPTHDIQTIEIPKTIDVGYELAELMLNLLKKDEISSVLYQPVLGFIEY